MIWSLKFLLISIISFFSSHPNAIISKFNFIKLVTIYHSSNPPCFSNGLKNSFSFQLSPYSVPCSVRYLNHFQSSQLNITSPYSCTFPLFHTLIFLIFSVNRIYLFIFIFNFIFLFFRVLLNIDTNSIFIINAINENPQIHIFINIYLYMCVHIQAVVHNNLCSIFLEWGLVHSYYIMFLFSNGKSHLQKNKPAAP